MPVEPRAHEDESHDALQREIARLQAEVARLEASQQRLGERLEREGQNRRRFAAMVESTSDFIALADPAGNTLFMNRAGRRLAGVSDEAVVEGVALTMFHPEWASRRLLSIAIPAAIEHGTWSGETALLGPEGQEIPVSQVILAHRAPTGEVEFLSTIARDIAEQRRLYDELRASEVRFRELIRDLDVGVVVQGPRAEVRVANAAALELLGLTEAQFVGSSSFDPEWNIVREDGSPFPAEQRPVASVLATGKPARNVVMGVFRPRTQDRAWLLVNAEPEFESDGTVRQVVITLGDLTERKRLEASLLQAQKLEGLGRLAGGIAHDFNNLLTVISAYTTLALRRLPADSAARSDLGYTLEASRSAAALTTQLLAFARKQVAAPRLVHLPDVLRTVRTLLARLIGGHIELVVHVADEVGLVRIDPSQLEQVLVNLAMNARDAMPEGGTLSIDVRPVQHDGAEWVGVHVRDTGTGIDEQTRAHIFEPFFTTKEVGRGTGLGLATVHGIVTQNGGHISLESQLGTGTTFSILLPKAEGRMSREITRVPETTRRGNETLLVVEDEPRLRALATRILLDHGYRVLEAGNGVEALEVSSKHDGPVDLLLTDLLMAKMGGRKLAEALRTARPGLRVMYVSGFADEPPPDGDFLAKPYTPEHLLGKIRALLDRDR